MALRQPVAESRRRNPVLARPVLEDHSAAVHLQPMVLPGISRLFSACGPSHIPRLVVAIVVRKAVKAVRPGRPLSDISQEALKPALAVLAVAPATAHADAPAAIVLEPRNLGVFTSRDDVTPDQIGGAFPSLSVSVNGVPCNYQIFDEAAAASCYSIPKPRVSNHDFLSAVALAQPLPPSLIRFSASGGGCPLGRLQDDQAFKPRAYHRRLDVLLRLT